jgi:hypothetical protein
MRNDKGYRILTRPVAVAGILGWVLLAANATGCGQSAVTPQLVQCKLDALRVLPLDPAQVTVADAVDVVSRIKACHQPADAGSQ